MTEKQSRSQLNSRRFAFGIAITVLLVAFYGWRMAIWNRFPFEYDAGIHLILAKLWAAGYEPYREIFVSYPPVFMWSLGLPWQWFGGVDAVRFLMVTYALTAVPAVMYLGAVYHSKSAGLAAGVLLAFVPAWFIPSFAIMTEIPSISIAVVAITCAEVYRWQGGWGWAALAGLVLAISFSLKILPLFAALLIAVLLVSRSVRGGDAVILKWRPAAFALLAAGVGGAIGLLAPLLFYSWPDLYRQVLEMRFVSREAYNPLDSNNRMIVAFLARNAALSVWALYGLAFVLLPAWRKTWPLLLWPALVWLNMAFHVPLRDKHLPIFLPIVALLAGIGLIDWATQARRLFIGKPTRRQAGLVTAGALAAILLLRQLPGMIAENNAQSPDDVVNSQRETAIELIAQIAAPADCVAADNPVFLYQTDHLPPPQLSETSQTRIDTGFLTLADVAESLDRYACHVTAVVSPRFRSIDGLEVWLAHHYLARLALPETDVYFGKLNDPGDYQPVPEAFNLAGLAFDGVSLAPAGTWLAGEAAYVSLVWRAAGPLTADYRRTVTLRRVDDPAPLAFVTDRPFLGLANLAAWPVGAQARETVRLDIPVDVPSGAYQLALSVCTVQNGECPNPVYAFLGDIIINP